MYIGILIITQDLLITHREDMYIDILSITQKPQTRLARPGTDQMALGKIKYMVRTLIVKPDKKLIPYSTVAYSPTKTGHLT